MSTTRLFVAILPPLAVRAELAALVRPLDAVQWTMEQNLHLTLRFIGATVQRKVTAFATALAKVSVEPFVLPVGNIGVFPEQGPARVLWAGIGRGHTRLYQLRKQVDEALLSVDMTLDVHRFHPHFTLGRLGDDCDAKGLAKFLERLGEFEAPPFRVSEFHLMASDANAGHPSTYRTVQSFALRGSPVRTH